MLNNTQFAKENDVFLKACTAVQQNLPDYKEFEPSTRQASKFRMGKGIAYRNRINNLPKEIRT